MRIGIYGDSFDPPTAAHAEIIEWLVRGADSPQLDEVWILPAVDHAFSKHLSPYNVRNGLVEAMIRDIGVQGTRVVRRDETYTVDLLENLHRENPETKFLLVLGADCIQDSHKWKNWNRCLQLADLVVIGRDGCNIEDLGVHATMLKKSAVSSTRVRASLANGDLTRLMGEDADVTPSVIQLIMRDELYGYKGD